MRQVALYTRVSTDRQTTENQEIELRAIAKRAGWNVVKVYCDEGISGAKGRDERPAFDAPCKDPARRQFDMVMTWSVDRLGRSLQDLINFLSELHAPRDRPHAAPAGARHDHARREGDVSDNGGVRRGAHGPSTSSPVLGYGR
jgi:DNA invertase Pin-like site-specific DNA recombinase